MSYSIHFSFSTFFSVSCHIPGLPVCVSHIFHVFQVSCIIPSPTVCISHFLCFAVFLALFQILECPFIIFHVFQCFSPYSSSYIELFSFSKFFTVSCHIPGHAVFLSHFPRFSLFSPNSKSYCMHFSFSTIFIVSRHILGPTVSISHFPRFFTVSPHIPAHTLFVSHFPRFSGFVFFFFLPFFKTCIVRFKLFHVFSIFLQYSTSSSVHFTFSKFFSVFRHFQYRKECVSHCQYFSVFLQYFRS